MASFQSELLDRVSCGVCLEPFDDKAHVPKILPCQHTFCQSCLTSISADTINLECPVCRKKHEVPLRGFTTNRVVIDVIEELLKDTTSKVLKCARHTSMDSVLVCINCLEGLCIKCVKPKGKVTFKGGRMERRKTSNRHQSHQLEELSDAKLQLRQKFERQAKAEQYSLQQNIFTINQSACSVREITKAESDINEMCHKLNAAITKWKDAQLAKLSTFKQKATEREDKMCARVTKLQSLLQKQDTDLVTLTTELKHGATLRDQFPDVDDFIDRNQFDLEERCKDLSKRLHSELGSNKSFTSKLLQRQPSSSDESDEYPYHTEELTDFREPNNEVFNQPQAAVLGSINDDLTLGALFLANFMIIFLPVLAIIRIFDEENEIHRRRDLRNQIKRILFIQKPDLQRDLQLQNLNQKFDLLVMLCMLMCILTVHLILLFQISDYAFVFAFKYVCGFVFVYSGVVSMMLACLCVFICLRPGYSTHIISLGIDSTQFLPLQPLGFLRRIIVMLELRRMP